MLLFLLCRAPGHVITSWVCLLWRGRKSSSTLPEANRIGKLLNRETKFTSSPTATETQVRIQFSHPSWFVSGRLSPRLSEVRRMQGGVYSLRFVCPCATALPTFGTVSPSHHRTVGDAAGVSHAPAPVLHRGTLSVGPPPTEHVDDVAPGQEKNTTNALVQKV